MALNDGGDALIEVLREALDALGGIQVRRMFGGHGLFQDGLMFALISDDVLYLKADATTQPDFEAEGMLPFTYERRDGKTTVMSYWRAPERLLDETDELQEWASRAISADGSARMGCAMK